MTEFFLLIYINGEEFAVPETSMSLKELLELASENPATGIDSDDIRYYYINDSNTGMKYIHLDDTVELKDHDNFLAIHAGATPIA